MTVGCVSCLLNLALTMVEFKYLTATCRIVYHHSPRYMSRLDAIDALIHACQGKTFTYVALTEPAP